MNQIEELHFSIIEKAIEQLDVRSKYIIKARWLSENQQSFDELAEKFNISSARVSQLEKQARIKIKEILSSNYIS